MDIYEKIRRFGKVKVLHDLGHYGLSARLKAALEFKAKARKSNVLADIDKAMNECGEIELEAFNTLYRYNRMPIG